MPVAPSRPLILILEDDASAAGALVTLLDDWGYDVVHATGLKGLTGALTDRASEVRAVITDYHLNGCTAPEAIEALRLTGVGAKVLMMTGTLRGKARLDAHAGAHDFLEKPAAAGDILSWLTRAVSA